MAGATGRIRVGTSGYDYPNWTGAFYPEGLAARRRLEYASHAFDTIELNGTFYSLKCPAVYERWAAEVPARDFVFAVKGSRFITHNLKLRHAETALANFYASGILALGRKTGPFLWQLPATYSFDPGRFEDFFAILPQSSTDAARLAKKHDARLERGALVESSVHVRYRHAFEVRHPSYFTDAFFELLARHHAAFVIADTAGTFPFAEEITTDFAYVRLHGSQQLYASGYTDDELDVWARRAGRWARRGLDVYVYFDNDAWAHAPGDARRLAELVRRRPLRRTA